MQVNSSLCSCCSFFVCSFQFIGVLEISFLVTKIFKRQFATMLMEVIGFPEQSTTLLRQDQNSIVPALLLGFNLSCIVSNSRQNQSGSRASSATVVSPTSSLYSILNVGVDV